MKLLTHNMLQSPGTRRGYPLAIEVEKVETVETEFNADFIQRMVEKLDYDGLVATVASVSRAPATRTREDGLPPMRPTLPSALAALTRALALCTRSLACRSRSHPLCRPTLARTRPF